MPAKGTTNKHIVLAGEGTPPPPREVTENGACKGQDPNMFHPGPSDFKQMAACKALCDACKVKEPCGEYAIVYVIPGFWGGMSERERRRIRGERIRGSWKKNDSEE